MSIMIRKAEQHDAESLSELFLEFVDSRSNIDQMKRQIEKISKMPNYYIVVASRDGRVIGTAMGIVCYDLVGNCDPFLLIENVVVGELERGSGVGTMLINSMEEFALSHNCNFIILASSENRVRAHIFYEHLGFIGEKRGFIKTIKNQNIFY